MVGMPGPRPPSPGEVLTEMLTGDYIALAPTPSVCLSARRMSAGTWEERLRSLSVAVEVLKERKATLKDIAEGGDGEGTRPRHAENLETKKHGGTQPPRVASIRYTRGADIQASRPNRTPVPAD